MKNMTQGGSNNKIPDDNSHTSQQPFGNNIRHYNHQKPNNRGYNSNYFEGNYQNRRNGNNSYNAHVSLNKQRHRQFNSDPKFLIVLNNDCNENHANEINVEKKEHSGSSNTIQQALSVNSGNYGDLNALVSSSSCDGAIAADSTITDPSVIAYDTGSGAMSNYVQAQPFYPAYTQLNQNMMAVGSGKSFVQLTGHMSAPKTAGEETAGLQVALKDTRPIGAVNFNARLSVYIDGSDLPSKFQSGLNV